MSTANNPPDKAEMKVHLFRKDMKRLVSMLDTPGLHTIDLGFQSIGAKGADTLSTAVLQAAPNLRTLILNNNELENKGAVALAALMRSCPSLQSLNLAWNSIGNQGANALADALAEPDATLQNLNLRLNNIWAPGATAISNALHSNTSLQFLSLDSNQLGKLGGAAIAEALVTNHTLQGLNLNYNSVVDEGAMALASALRSNRGLHTLVVWNNAMTMDGILALAQAMEDNTTMQELMLSSSFEEEAAAEVKRALGTNTACRTFSVRNRPGTLNTQKAEAFCKAAMEGDIEAAEDLLEWGVAVDSLVRLKDLERLTPLARAVDLEDDTVVEMLRVWGANPCVKHTWESASAQQMAMAKPWRPQWHWMWPSHLDGQVEAVVAMNTEERYLMFECGGMDEYEPTEQWSTLPDEVLYRVLRWMA